eukprot:TRINITY_DN3619_c0_g1_i7.p1 TRINITY_DN3619_c0_g1~~TRINITY_DN3619_c0_g1_i7.p1  ORF type:complete len:446 (+),score=90.80 TRINITY_DN3619_c0_g1_i7:119-1456(+)
MCIRDRSSNVPHDGLRTWIKDNTFWSIVGNSLVCATLTGVIDALLVPPVARLLVYIQGEYNHNTEIPTLIQKGKAQLTMMVNLSFVLSIIVPIVLVVTLDHSCFRYYIKFAPDLEELLDSWDSAQTGIAAYRKGFCTRRLIELYGCVWAARILMMIVTGPILQYLKSSRSLQRVVTTGMGNLGLKKLASGLFARDVDHIQEDLAITYQMIGILVTFGLHVPVLSLLSVFFVLTNTIAVVYVVNLKLNTQSSNLSEMLLVRYPASPLVFFILVGYAFTSWFYWDNDLDFAQLMYCWPAVFLVGAICMVFRDRFKSSLMEEISVDEILQDEQQERDQLCLTLKPDFGPDGPVGLHSPPSLSVSDLGPDDPRDPLPPAFNEGPPAQAWSAEPIYNPEYQEDEAPLYCESGDDDQSDVQSVDPGALSPGSEAPEIAETRPLLGLGDEPA